MEANKILSADLLDLVFDDRNKLYGAYELRRTYPQRIKKALLVTTFIAVLIFTGALLANSLRPDNSENLVIKSVDLTRIDEEIPEPEPIPPPERRPEPEPVRTEQLSTTRIMRDEDVEEPPPTQDELVGAKIDVMKTDGVEDAELTTVTGIDEGKGIIETKKAEPEGPFVSVQVPAKFKGNWEKFLTRNLNSGTPVENGAAPGRYRVVIQFVVDTDGSVSRITPISNNGYGMEEEAVRVLKKAEKWEPAIQNGRQVQAYHKQVIVFEVVEE